MFYLDNATLKAIQILTLCTVTGIKNDELDLKKTKKIFGLLHTDVEKCFLLIGLYNFIY